MAKREPKGHEFPPLSISHKERLEAATTLQAEAKRLHKQGEHAKSEEGMRRVVHLYVRSATLAAAVGAEGLVYQIEKDLARLCEEGPERRAYRRPKDNAGRKPARRRKKKPKKKVKGSQKVNQLVRDQFRDIYGS